MLLKDYWKSKGFVVFDKERSVLICHQTEKTAKNFVIYTVGYKE